MKYFKILTMAVAILCLFSCNKDNGHKKKHDDPKDKIYYGIKKEVALNSLEEFLEAIEYQADLSTAEVKKIGRREIKELLGEDATSVMLLYEKFLQGKPLPDTLLYSVAFVDNVSGKGGAALLAGDRQLNAPILYFAPESVIDSPDLPLQKAGQAISSKAASAESGDKDFVDMNEGFPGILLVMSIIGDYNDNISMSSKGQNLTNVYGPYVETHWWPDSPFCDLLLSEEGENVEGMSHRAGSVVIALMQIMAQQNKPQASEIYSSASTWDELKMIGKETYSAELGAKAANIVSILSNEENCNVSYVTSNSEDELAGAASCSASALKTMKKYGYSTASRVLGGGKDNQAKIDEMLKSGKPVYMDGEFSGMGQAWVVDGLCGDMYHINWGLGSEFDGYIARNMFASAASFDLNRILLVGALGKAEELPAELDLNFYFRVILY